MRRTCKLTIMKLDNSNAWYMPSGLHQHALPADGVTRVPLLQHCSCAFERLRPYHNFEMAACFETHAAEEEADTICDTQHLEMNQSVDLLQVHFSATLSFVYTRTHMDKSMLVQPFGVSEGDIKKLKEHNLYTIEAVARTNKRLLMTLKGLSEKKVDKIQQEGAEQSSCPSQICRHWHWEGMTLTTHVCLQLSSSSIWDLSQQPQSCHAG